MGGGGKEGGDAVGITEQKMVFSVFLLLVQTSVELQQKHQQR